jgi:hypothetical protein
MSRHWRFLAPERQPPERRRPRDHGGYFGHARPVVRPCGAARAIVSAPVSEAPVAAVPPPALTADARRALAAEAYREGKPWRAVAILCGAVTPRRKVEGTPS